MRPSAGVRRRPCSGEPWACVLGLLYGIWSFNGIPSTLCQEHLIAWRGFGLFFIINPSIPRYKIGLA